MIALAVPAAMGMIFNTLYNLTDFWFAGRLSEDALAGVSIAGAIFFLIISISMGMQTGTTAMVATEVGKGNTDTVIDWLDNATGLGILFGVICTLLGLLFTDTLIKFLGAEPNVLPHARQYIIVVLWGTIAFVLASVAAGALVALGDTVSNRNVLAFGLIANVILNPIFIFVLDMGVIGLALGTVIIKVGSAAYLYLVLKRRLHRWAKPALQLSYWNNLLKQVLPASMNMLMIVIGGFITVSFIGRFGSQQVAGYAVGLRIEQILLLPALGLNSAVMALVGQNFGANKMGRLVEIYKKALWTGFFIAAVSVPIMIFLSPILLGFFSANEQMIKTGTTYLRIDAIAFFAYVVLFISVASLQAIKKPMFPMFLGIARHLTLPVSVNYLLIVVFEMPMITLFISIVIIVLASAVVSHIYTWRQLNRLGNPDID